MPALLRPDQAIVMHVVTNKNSLIFCHKFKEGASILVGKNILGCIVDQACTGSLQSLTLCACFSSIIHTFNCIYVT